MPTIRKLDPDEINTLRRFKLKQQQEADTLLADLVRGEWVEVALDAGDSLLKMRNRLVSAAGRRGLHLSLRCISGNSVRLEVKVAQRSEVEESG